ncbi:Mu transposase C-terminal domain-containing protein [Bacillus cereus]|uniref:Mu transposase C-terminal domain-containing protein n=1 Tax=Bacillus cereus TaxID=1396 RepID=UPI003671D95C
MSFYQFIHGARFLVDDNEYVVHKEYESDIEIKNLYYNRKETWGRTELLKLWEQGRLIFRNEQAPSYLNVSLDDLPIELKEAAVWRYKILKPYIDGEVLSSEIDIYLSSLPENKKVSKATFYRWKKRWDTHQNIQSLAPKSNYKGPRCSRVPNEVVQIVQKVLEEQIYGGEKRTLEQLYSEVLLQIEEINQFREEKEYIKTISQSTLYRMRKAMLDKHRLNQIRYGKVQADLIKKGSTTEVTVDRPLERVEIDWTFVDVLLINPKTLKPERPWLVYAVDKCTKYPLGFYVTFDDIDTQALKQCLLHAMMPKAYIKDIYPEVEGEWIAFGKPGLIVLDNAKVNESIDLDDVCLQLGIDRLYCKVGSGHQKGTIERAFRTLNTRFVHTLKGTTFSNPLERGYYKSEEKACIGMQGFIYMVHIAMVDLVANTYNSTLGATPQQVWEQKMQEYPHLRSPMLQSKKELQLLLMGGLEYRTITNKGVVIQNEYYTSLELIGLKNWLEAQGEGREVKVRYDLADMRSVYIYDRYNRAYIEAKATGLNRKAISIDYPVHITQLQIKSQINNERKHEQDKTQVARAHRKIQKIQAEQDKEIKKRIQNEQHLEMKIDNPYTIVSSDNISHIQLQTPIGVDTLLIIPETQEQPILNKKSKKEKDAIGKMDKHLIEDRVGVSYDIDSDDLPDWNVIVDGKKG